MQILYGATTPSFHRSWLAQWPSRGDVTQGQSARIASIQILREVQSLPVLTPSCPEGDAAEFEQQA
jgi:hypothetical protein